jgi:hypothetical protein
VFEARKVVLRESIKPPGNNVIGELIYNKVVEIGDGNPKAKQIMDSATTGSLRGIVKEISKHYNQHEKLCVVEYEHWPWKLLERDTSQHTGSACEACRTGKRQSAVYSLLNIDENGNPIPASRMKFKIPRREACAEDFVSYVCHAYGMLECITGRDLKKHLWPAVVEYTKEEGKRQKMKGHSKGYSSGKRIVKKVNEEFLIISTALEMMGNGMSQGKAFNRRISTHNTVRDAGRLACDRLAKEKSGEKAPKNRAGLWGKDESNHRLLFDALDE